MIKINLIDDEELAKLKQMQKKSTAQTIQITSPKIKKAIMIGISIASLLYLMFLLYFIFMVRAPLVDLKKELADTQSALNQLKPSVEMVTKLNKDISEIKKRTSEYEKFIDGRFNIAKILNILSDDLPEEIVFLQLSLGPKELVIKERTKNGLVTTKSMATNLTIKVSVSEEYQSKVSQYIRKLKENEKFEGKLVDIKHAGLSLRDKKYSGDIQLFFKDTDGGLK